jgi:hypothetical protein
MQLFGNYNQIAPVVQLEPICPTYRFSRISNRHEYGGTDGEQ